MSTQAFKLGAGALALFLVAACARDSQSEQRPPTTTPPDDAAAGDLESWNPTPEEVNLMPEAAYQDQARQQINEGNVDAEFRKLQQELGGGGGG